MRTYVLLFDDGRANQTVRAHNPADAVAKRSGYRLPMQVCEPGAINRWAERMRQPTTEIRTPLHARMYGSEDHMRADWDDPTW